MNEEQSYFPIRIFIPNTGEKKVITSSDKLPIGVSFKVLEVSVEREKKEKKENNNFFHNH